MPRIVDGDNLLGSLPGGARTDHARLCLAHAIDRLARLRRRRILLVFDGPAPSPVQNATVQFAGPGKSADDTIVSFLGRQPAGKNWIVVTDDAALARQCRALGARIESCPAFAQRFLVATEAEKPSGQGDLDYWRRAFGVEDE